MFKIKVKCSDASIGEEFIDRLYNVVVRGKGTCPIPHPCKKTTDETCLDCMKKYIKIKVVEDK